MKHRVVRTAVTVVVAMVVASSALIGTAPTVGATAPDSWSVMPGPTTTTNDRLVDVSCSSATACTAVGYSDTATSTQEVGVHQLRAEALQGSSWVATAPIDVTVDDQFASISCVSATFCMAVGYTGEGPTSTNPRASWTTLAEVWNGSAWSVTPAPTATQWGALYGVSCVSTTHCVAVGSSVEEWDGSSWTVDQSVPSVSDSEETMLSGVSCVSTSACMAVGWAAPEGGLTTPFSLEWDGTTWTDLPPPATATGAVLNRVSCSGPSYCMAVGLATKSGWASGPDAEVWNGTTWSETLVPSGDDEGELYGVSCPSSTSCVATGLDYGGPSDRYDTEALTWDGTTWTNTVANTPGRLGQFNGVTCPAPGACLAVGWVALGYVAQPIVEYQVPDPSTSSMSTSPPAGAFGQSVTLTDAVTSSASPGGVVTFTADRTSPPGLGGVSLCSAPVISGVATCQTTLLPVGLDEILAVYAGDSVTGSSTSSASIDVTGPAATSVFSVQASPEPQEAGQPVTYSAVVGSNAGSVNGGTVTFSSGSTTLCSGPVTDSQATCVGQTPSVGNNTITANYGGTSDFQPSSGTGQLTGNTLAATVTTPMVFPGVVLPGTDVTYSATVTATTGTPTGTVSFSTFGATLCIATLSDGVATCDSASAPSGVGLSVTAAYSGDSADNSSTGTATLTVTPPADDTVTVELPSSTVVVGTQVEFTAAVAPGGASGSPTGTVSFTAGSTTLCSAPVIASVASCSSSALPLGNNQTISAEYSGDPSFVAQEGSALLTVIPPVQTTTALRTTSPQVVLGAPSTYSATVSTAAPVPNPSGVVTFAVGFTTLCVGTLVGGVASCTASNAPLGVDHVTATYVGDSSYGGSTGATTQVVVRPVGIQCAKLSGNAKRTLAIASCTSKSKAAKRAKVSPSLIVGSATATWVPDGATSALQVTVTAVGQGSCPSGRIELDGTGYVAGGTSVYTSLDDPVAFRVCEAKSGRITLVPGTFLSL